MKKAFLILSLVLGLCAGSYAQSFFGRGGEIYGNAAKDGEVVLPGHEGTENADGDPTTPLAGGALLLIGFGAAYALSKKNKKD